MISAADLVRIVEAGVRAPSADNQHHFRVQPAERGLRIVADSAALASFHRRILALVSLGAVIENMLIRAAALGYSPHVEWFPDAARPTLMASVLLSEGVPRASPLDAAIGTRHTNRRLAFAGPALSASELASFAAAAAAIDGVRLHWVEGDARTRLLRLMLLAEAERFNHRAMHEDLFSAVRFDVGWHATADTGLPPAALQVEPGARWAFAQLRRWPVMNLLRRIGFHRSLGLRAAWLPARLAPHLGFLTTSAPLDPGGAIAIGRALERVWLEAEHRGLAFQPFAAAGLLARPEYGDVPRALGEALRTGWAALTADTPLMVFRMGRAKRPSTTTDRRPAGTYIDRAT